MLYRGTGHLANNLANFELANQILVGEPNFDLANTNEFFANPNKIWRTEMRLGELHFELREQQNFYQWDQMVNFSNFRQKNIFTVNIEIARERDLKFQAAATGHSRVIRKIPLLQLQHF